MMIPYAYIYVTIGLVVVLAIIIGQVAEKKGKTPLKAVAWMLGIGGLIGGLGVFIAGSKVLIFKAGDGGITYEKVFLLGKKTVKIDKGEVDLASSEGSVWIVNDTGTDLRIHTAEYSTISFSFGGGTPDRTVRPGTADTVSRVDNIGPDDPLPSSVSSKSSSETRVQVTW